jgi:orotate phosphoribosyltransferase
MNQPNDLLALLAGRRGHFQMESGYHTEAWFELDRLFADADRLQPFVLEFAQRLAHHRVEAIVGPETGGATLAKMIADEMGPRPAPTASDAAADNDRSLAIPSFATKRIEAPAATDGLFPVRYQIPSAAREKLLGLRVAIVDDAISAGSAVRGTFADLRACGARPVALGALIIFGDAAAPFARENRLAIEAIARTSFAMWKPDACPLCRVGTPLEKVSDAPKK